MSVNATDNFVLNLKNKIQNTHLSLKAMILNNRQMGIQAASMLSGAIDEIIHIIFVKHFSNTMQNQIAIIAVGGYGRGFLAPFCDIDLCLVVIKMTDDLDNSIRGFLYDIWDLKLKIGYSTGTINDMITTCHDMTKRTALLERRFLCGSLEIYDELSKEFIVLQDNTTLEFIKAKLYERTIRHQNAGYSRYLVEPDLKNSKGGLRDIHVIMWIAKYIYKTNTPQDLIDNGVLSQKDFN